MKRKIMGGVAGIGLLAITLCGCAAAPRENVYFDPNMDFGFVQTVAVMPFENLTTNEQAAERVRDTFTTMLLATGAFYVVPSGEVARGIERLRIQNPAAPSPEQVQSLAGVINVDAVITGVVREYGVARSGTAEANLVSLSVKMMEIELGRVVWSASSTKGGVTMSDRLFGGGGEPMNDVTVEAVRDVINQLFE